MSFDEWFLTQLDGSDETEPTLKIAKMWSCSAFKAGAQSRQAEIDELQKRIDKTLEYIECYYGVVGLGMIIDILEGGQS